MNDAQPQVEAVAVSAGVITAIGSAQELEALRGPATRMVDLQGRTLIPGFVDPHSHIGGVGLQAISANLLPPPDGGNASIADLQQTLREYIKTSPEVKQLGIVLGFGYDDSQLQERRHPHATTSMPSPRSADCRDSPVRAFRRTQPGSWPVPALVRAHPTPRAE
jgi:predicted amidohydrolase YtcJ